MAVKEVIYNQEKHIRDLKNRGSIGGGGAGGSQRRGGVGGGGGRPVKPHSLVI